jgi:hypothetical protein
MRRVRRWQARIVGEVQASEAARAVAAAMSIASSLDLTVDDAIVLHDSNKLTLRVLPCDLLARVAPVAHQVAQFEVEIASTRPKNSWRAATTLRRSRTRTGSCSAIRYET